MSKSRIIAFYLPQFYPTPENDEWWEPGFTEWTNVAKAKPLFRGHYQPRIPRDLGFYDLRVPETREKQAMLARDAGVEGFCYWHYWFGNGKRLLSRVFNEVLESGKPDFPFCLGWANHSWYAKTWDKNGKDKLLMEQTYPGETDYYQHFQYALKAFQDKRYIKVEGSPLFYIYDALSVPEDFLTIWNRLAVANGFHNGICFIGRIKKNEDYKIAKERGFSYITVERMSDISSKKSLLSRRWHQLRNFICRKPINTFSYAEAIPHFTDLEFDSKQDVVPMIIPNWDHSPRSSWKALIFDKSTPALFKKHLESVLQVVCSKPEKDRIVFLKSWNEWGEGNYMEPDSKWGLQYIQTLRKALDCER